MIPKIIHQTCKTDDIPDQWVDLVRSWKTYHPDWQYKLWTNKNGVEFVKNEYPDFYATYCNLSYDIQRADAIRYLAVHKFGGLYVDIDYECLQSFDEFLTQHQFIIGQEPEEQAIGHGQKSLLCNALFGAEPEHRFLGALLELIQKAPPALTHLDVLATTGPIMVQRCFEEFGDKGLSVFSSKTLCPLAFNSPMLKTLISKGSESGEIKRFLRDQGSYAIHYWANSWVNRLSGDLDNPRPNSINGFKFYPGLDSPGNDLFNGGRNINLLASKCTQDFRVEGFNTDGFAKSKLRDSAQWRTMDGAAENEGLYVKLT